MYFHNVNKFNARANNISGNCFPMTSDSNSIVFIWTFRPLFIIRDKDVFTTKDYQVEVNLIFFNDEFGIGLFLCGLVFQAISQIYLFCKQSGLSLYIIHFVRILTAEYQYVQENLSQVVRNSVDNKFDEELKHVLKQYSIIIQISKELPKLFSINVTTTYINSTIKLSILAYKVVHGSKDFFERLLVTFYASGIITEVYLMCDSIDLLKESSTSIFDQAFHEPWYKHNLSFKKIFLLMVLTNRMECRLTTCKPTDLTLPALKTILSNAYSAGLLLMGMQ
ncbi:uncharacterized protein [Chelonus insularis]|uniref:uncharacterized protein n=1 Tax=Chelonus insularis TaxID=460826 RepID=UPI001588DDFE|nr:uncharacterized protein LOC118067299 [Chelonus insularis]